MKRFISVLTLSALVLAGCSDKSSSESCSESVPETTAASEAVSDSETSLEFRMGESSDGELILTEKNVKTANASMMFDEKGSEKYVITVELDEEGTQLFSEATEKAAENKDIISIWYNGELISAPAVNAHVTDGNMIISGDFDLDEAIEIAENINGSNADTSKVGE